MQIHPFNTSDLLQMSVKPAENTAVPEEEMVRRPRMTYEQAKMKADMAKQKAAGQLKEKFPPKSIMERTVESMEAAEKEKKAEEETTDGEITSGDTSVDTGSGDTGANISEYV